MLTSCVCLKLALKLKLFSKIIVAPTYHAEKCRDSRKHVIIRLIIKTTLELLNFTAKHNVVAKNTTCNYNTIIIL